MKLFDKQLNAVYYLKDNKTTNLIYGGAAGGGKSALGCLWLIENCQSMPQTRWLMGRSKLKTLKETTLNTFFELSSKLGISDQFKYNSQDSVINWNNGSQILLKDLFFYPSDPEFDSLGSLEITGGFIDEVSQIIEKAWTIAGSRCRYKVKELNRLPKMLGTCNPFKGWGYREFYSKSKNNTLEPHKAFVRALPIDNPHLSKEYIQSLLRMDENSKQRLYYGNWEYDDDPSALIDYQKLSDIWSNDFVEAGEKYITADIARFGKDNTIIGYWEGWRLEEIHVYNKASITESANIIKTLATRKHVPMSSIVVDEDGVGGGVVDILKCNGFVNNSRPMAGSKSRKAENFNNLKSQCYFNLAEKINKNEVFVAQTDYADKLSEELEQVKQYNMDKDGKRMVLPKDKVKENIGRSPDFSDMMMMRAYFEYKRVFQFSINGETA